MAVVTCKFLLMGIVFSGAVLSLDAAATGRQPRALKDTIHKVDVINRVCAEKHAVPLELVLNTRKGGSSVDGNRNLKCFSHCVLDALHHFKDGKFDYEFTVVDAEKSPPEIRDFIKSAVDRCRYVSDGIEDKCEAAYLMTKCFYSDAPEILRRRVEVD